MSSEKRRLLVSDWLLLGTERSSYCPAPPCERSERIYSRRVENERETEEDTDLLLAIEELNPFCFLRHTYLLLRALIEVVIEKVAHAGKEIGR